jgi:hypothetical protein
VRIFVQHDEQGNIVSFAIPAKAADEGGFAPEGQATIEVDAGAIKEIGALQEASGDRGRHIAGVREALERHKVDIRAKKLVAK